MRAVQLMEGVLSASFRSVIASERLLRAGLSPESIHATRAAVRRLRSELRSFERALERRWARSLHDKLGRLNDELSRVRDTDVLLERVECNAEHLIGAEYLRAKSIIEICHQAGVDARMRLQSVMSEAWYGELFEQIARDAPREHLRIGRKKPARGFARKRIEKTLRRLRKSIKRCDAQPSDAQLHRLRIRAKHLRYLTEACAPLFGKRVHKITKRAVKIQRILGEAHDAALGYEKLRQLAQIASSMGDPELIFVAGELAALEGHAERSARARWRKLRISS